MKPAAVRYRLHVDLPVAFSCCGTLWRFEQLPVVSTNSLRCEAVGPRRYAVTTAADEQGMRRQLRQTGVEVRLNSYLCTLFLHLEQLGLAERMQDFELRRAS